MTLSSRKHQDITTCCRMSKPNWRPCIYSATNPGGVGHAWYRQKFTVPFQRGDERDTRFIPARVTDNWFTNAEYVKVLSSLTGWQKRACFEGDWPLQAPREHDGLFVHELCAGHRDGGGLGGPRRQLGGLGE